MPSRLPASTWPPTSKSPNQPDFNLVGQLRALGYQRIVGIDEVGRGAIAGPLVVAAVEINFKIVGVNDSKLILNPKRRTLAEQIHRQASQISFGLVSNAEIDRLGLSAAQRLAYDRALTNIKADLILTDNYPLLGGHYCRAIKGDRLFYPTAAASIVAKVYRDQLMRVYHQFHPGYGWVTNVGYGTVEHRAALADMGRCSLHRLTFG